jgi:hypothetical protein
VLCLQQLAERYVGAEPLTQPRPRPLKCYQIRGIRGRIAEAACLAPRGSVAVTLCPKLRQLQLHRCHFGFRTLPLIEQPLRLHRRNLADDQSKSGARRRHRWSLSSARTSNCLITSDRLRA